MVMKTKFGAIAIDQYSSAKCYFQVVGIKIIWASYFNVFDLHIKPEDDQTKQDKKTSHVLLSKCKNLVVK